MATYYNDNDPFVCAWLRNLITEGLLPAGEVDERPIQEVTADDVRGYQQAHFFAGIGGWAYALQLAGWGDRPIWTGSCPCQPFSAAGKRGSHADQRHLWPEWFRLVRECRPHVVVGEQVSGAAGLGWLDAVALDLESEGYAVGACVLGAHSVGAPHLRQRLWFVAESDSGQRRWRTVTARGNDSDRPNTGRSKGDGGAASDSSTRLVADAEHTERGTEPQGDRDAHGRHGFGRSSEPCRMDDATGARQQPTGERPEGEARDDARLRGPERRRATRSVADPLPAGRPEGRAGTGDGSVASGGESGELANTQEQRDRGNSRAVSAQDSTIPEWQQQIQSRPAAQCSGKISPWFECLWLPCRDGKARPIPPEPEIFPLVDGIPNRVGLLRGAGNAINPWTAAAFVRAYMECRP